MTFWDCFFVMSAAVLALIAVAGLTGCTSGEAGYWEHWRGCAKDPSCNASGYDSRCKISATGKTECE